MKTYVKICGLPAALLLASALAASAVQVTYQVNMSVQATLGNFTPGNGDTVMVAGSWDGWQTTNAHVLSVSGDPDIYTITLDQAAWSWPNYKFIINPYGTSTGGDLMWENLGPGVNRYFQVLDVATNLPVVFFNNLTNSSTVVVSPVTFEVNMGVQRELGKFDPTTDFVFVAGDFGWGATTRQLGQSADTNVWTGTFDLTNTPGTAVNYKFIMYTYADGEVWENNDVGPGGAQNRQFAFPATATNLPVVYFNNLTNASSVVTAPVAFEINLAVPLARGTFDPDFDAVSVAGDAINGWDETVSQLTRNDTNLSLWTGTFDVTGAPGVQVNYKFVLGGLTWENDGIGPGGAQNRQFLFPGVTTNLPAVYWNNVGNLGPLASSLAGGQLMLSWTSGPYIRLQTATSLDGTWNDLPDTLGLDSFTTNADSGNNFFRLIGP